MDKIERLMEIMFQEDMERYKNNQSLIYHTYEDFKAKIQEKQLTNPKTFDIIKSSKRYNKNIERNIKKMTKRELMEMVKNFDDNDEILFVTREIDRDGYPEDVAQNVYKIVKEGTPKKNQMYVD